MAELVGSGTWVGAIAVRLFVEEGVRVGFSGIGDGHGGEFIKITIAATNSPRMMR
jgi:hypothetical protein